MFLLILMVLFARMNCLYYVTENSITHMISTEKSEPMTDISTALLDPELGFLQFTVRRLTYRLSQGTTTVTHADHTAEGCIHEYKPEEIKQYTRVIPFKTIIEETKYPGGPIRYDIHGKNTQKYAMKRSINDGLPIDDTAFISYLSHTNK